MNVAEAIDSWVRQVHPELAAIFDHLVERVEALEQLHPQLSAIFDDLVERIEALEKGHVVTQAGSVAATPGVGTPPAGAASAAAELPEL